MNKITFLKFLNGTEIGVVISSGEPNEPYTLSSGNTIITVYDREYPTFEMCDNVFSKHVKEYKSGKYDKMIKDYNVDIKKVLRKVKKKL